MKPLSTFLAMLLFLAAPAGYAFAAGNSGMGSIQPQTALLVIDVQNDYFPGGKFELEGADAAAAKVRAAQDHFRRAGLPVIHVRHESLKPQAGFFLPGTPGADIHPLVRPLTGEAVVLKHFPNSFRETTLKAELDARGIKRLVVAGMMTLMCVDATVRAAADSGYEVVVLGDACAARALAYGEATISAAQVQGAFLAALGMAYAEVISTDEYLALPR
jgi:nicotinamidase-related amidase